MNRVLTIAAALSFSAGFALAQPEVAEPARPDYTGHRVVRVVTQNHEELARLVGVVNDVWNCRIGVGPLDVQVSPDRWAAFLDLNLPHQVTHTNVQALIDAEREEIERRRLQRDLSWFENYKTLDEINERLLHIAAQHPDLVTHFTIGNSLQNRPMNGIRFTGPDLPDNPRSTRPALLFNGMQHAREWVSPMTVLFITERLLEDFGSDPRTTNILNNTEIIILPMCNPDGYLFSWTNDRMWRKNRRLNTGGSYGVDLNRNWAYQWGGPGSSGTRSSQTYRGTAAFSEPETQRIRDFTNANPRIRANIDFHSYSQLILSPWGYSTGVPENNDAYLYLNPRLQLAVSGEHGFGYTAGPAGATLYLASGVIIDWMHGSKGIYSWTVELRDTGMHGFLLPPDQIIPTGQENLAGVKVLAEWVARQLQISFPDGLPEAGVGGEPTAFRVNITPQSGDVDPATPTVMYRFGAHGSFIAAPMNHDEGTTFLAAIPTAPCGETVQFYITANATLTNREVRSPSDAPASLYSFVVGGGTCCPADFNGDGTVDFFDYLDFVQAFDAEDPSADFNGDGNIDFFDYLDFVQAFSAGC